MLPSFKLSESAAKEDEICYDNSNNTLNIELNFKNANSFPNEAAEFISTFSWTISKISSIEQLGLGHLLVLFSIGFLQCMRVKLGVMLRYKPEGNPPLSLSD